MPTACPWDGYAPGVMKFCEARLCAWVVEPSNAWSNVAYVLVGLLILWSRRHHLRHILTLVGFSSVLIGLGSFAWHATAIRWGELLDVWSMYLFSSLFLVFNLGRLRPMGNAAKVGLYVALNVISIASMLALGDSGIVMFSLQVGVAVVLEIVLWIRERSEVDYRFFYGLVASFFAAWTIWWLDLLGIVCDPDNHILTGHAAWHLLTAVSLYCFYRFHAQRQGSEAR